MAVVASAATESEWAEPGRLGVACVRREPRAASREGGLGQGGNSGEAQSERREKTRGSV